MTKDWICGVGEFQWYKKIESQLYQIYCDKLMRTPGIIDKEEMLSKENIWNHVTKCNTSSSILFGCFPHENKCEIINNHRIKDESKRITTVKQGSTTRYIKRVYGRQIIYLPTTFGY